VCVCVRVCGARLLRLVRAADQTRLIICDETGVFRRRRRRRLRRPDATSPPHLTEPSKPHRTPSAVPLSVKGSHASWCT